MTHFSVKFEYCVTAYRVLCKAQGKLDERVATAGLSFNSHLMGAHYYGGRLLVMRSLSQRDVLTPTGHRAGSDDGKALWGGGSKALGLGPTSLTGWHKSLNLPGP